MLEKPFSLERAPEETVRRQAKLLRGIPHLDKVLGAVPSILLVLNGQRQIVYANRTFVDVLGLSGPEEAYGWRPGEMLECEHAWEDGERCPASGCCGTRDACRSCGAAQALFAAELGSDAVQECRIRQRKGGALDLRISTTPLVLEGEQFTILAAHDISHEKRRQALERVFFHDLLNTAGSIMGYAELLKYHKNDVNEISESLVRLVEQLADEIRGQRDLVQAENDDLTVSWDALNSKTLLAGTVHSLLQSDAGRDRQIELDGAVAEVDLVSDGRLLSRVLGNMLKNALEAIEPGQKVGVGCNASDGRVEFWVHNPGYIPREVQHQVFQRSFSTKGRGRGLGTYSMKLLGERYLFGKISFETSQTDGTRFRASFPCKPPKKS